MSHSMRMFKTAAERFAWAVGIFEGEGSFIVGGDKRWPTLQIKLGMCDEDVLRAASEILGLSVTGPYAAKIAGRKLMWRATRGGQAAWNTALLMLPYLGTRRRARAEEIMQQINASRREKKLARIRRLI